MPVYPGATQVLIRVQQVKQSRVLRAVADVPLRSHGAAVGAVKPSADSQQGALASAVLSDDRDRLATPHRQCRILEDELAAKALTDARGSEQLVAGEGPAAADRSPTGPAARCARAHGVSSTPIAVRSSGSAVARNWRS